MPSNAFTHMDEVTRRRIVAILASQSIEAGTLPPRYVDLAHLLFGDPASSEDVGHLVDLAAVPAFEQAISKVAETLRLLESTLWSTRLGDRPLALDIAKQLKQPQPGSTATAESLSKLASEIDGRMEDHLAYLKERAIYLGLNAYLRERYLALPSQLASKKFQKAWKTNALAASETVAMIGTELATAAVEARRPKNVAAILTRKARIKKADAADEPLTGVAANGQGLPEAGLVTDTNGGVPASPIIPAAPASEAVSPSEPVYGPTPPIAQDNLTRRSDRREDKGSPARAHTANQSPKRPEAEDHKLPYRGPSVELDWETIVNIIRYRCNFDRGYIDKDKKLTNSQKKIQIDPLNILKYHEKRYINDTVRINDILREFGHPAALGSYGGMNNTEPCPGFFAELEKTKRRQQRKTYISLLKQNSRDTSFKTIKSIFGGFVDPKFYPLIYLFQQRREIVGGSAFRTPASDWWENIFSYDAYYPYTLLQCKLALKALAVLDMHPVCQGTANIPAGDFFKKGAFYVSVKPASMAYFRRNRGQYLNEIRKTLAEELAKCGDMPELRDIYSVPKYEYDEMKSRWIADCQMDGQNMQSTIIDIDTDFAYGHLNDYDGKS